MNVVKSIKVLFVCWSLVQSSFVFAVGGSSISPDNSEVSPCPVQSEGMFGGFFSPLVNFFNGMHCEPLQIVLSNAAEASGQSSDNFCRIMLESDAIDTCMGTAITADERRSFNIRLEEKAAEDIEIRNRSINAMRDTLLGLAETVRLSEAIYSDAEAITDYSVANGVTYEVALNTIKSCVSDNVPDLLSAEKACEGGDSSEQKHFTDSLTAVEGSCSSSGSFANCGFIEKQNGTTVESIGFIPSRSSGLIGHIEDSSRYYGVLFPEEIRRPYLSDTFTVPSPLGGLGIQVPTTSADINLNTVKEQMHKLVGLMLNRVGDDHPRFHTNQEIFNHVYRLTSLGGGADIDQLVLFVNNSGGDDIPQSQRFGALSLMRNMSPRINFSDEGWRSQLLNDKILKASFLSSEDAYNSLGGSSVIKDQETLNEALRKFKLRKVNEVVTNCAAAQNDISNNFCGRVPTAEVSEAMVGDMDQTGDEVSREELIDARLHCWNMKRAHDIDRIERSYNSGDMTRRNGLCRIINNTTNRIFTEEASSELSTAIDQCSRRPTPDSRELQGVATSGQRPTSAGLGGSEVDSELDRVTGAILERVNWETDELRNSHLPSVVKNLSENSSTRSVARGTVGSIAAATMGSGFSNSVQGFSAGTPVESVINQRVEEMLEQDTDAMTPESRALLDELSSMRDKLSSLERRLSAKQTQLDESTDAEGTSDASVDSNLANEIKDLQDELAKARLEANELLKTDETLPTRTSAPAVTAGRIVSGGGALSGAPVTAAPRESVAGASGGFSHAATGVQASARSTDPVADVLGSSFRFSTSGGFGGGAIERTQEQVSGLEQISGYNVSLISQKVAGGNQVVVETEAGVKLLCEKNDTEEDGISCKTLSIVEELTASEDVEIESPLRVDPSRRVIRLQGLESLIDGENR